MREPERRPAVRGDVFERTENEMKKEWKRRTVAVLLTGSVILGGCRARNTKESSTDTEEESTAEQTEQTEQTEAPVHEPVTLAMPDETFFKALRDEHGLDGNYGDHFVIGENGKYRHVSYGMAASRSIYTLVDASQADMYIAFLFSEEGYNYMKSKDVNYSRMSLDDYRHVMENNYPRYDKILDDDYNLVQMPLERVAITVEPEFDIAGIDLDKYMESVEEGFRIMTTDPDLKTRIEDAINTPTIDGNSILQVVFHLMLDKDKNIVVSVELESFKQETLLTVQNTVSFGMDIQNTMLSVPYITTRQGFVEELVENDKIYIQEDIYHSYEFFERLDAFHTEYGTNEQQVQEIPDNELICVEFSDTFKTRYYYFGEGKWAFEQKLIGDKRTFEVSDQGVNNKYADELLARIGLNLLSIDLLRAEPITYDIFSSFYSNPKLSKEYKDANEQRVSFYSYDDDTWDFYVLRNGEDFQYCEKNTLGWTNNYTGMQEDTYYDFYEYIQSGNEKYSNRSSVSKDYQVTSAFGGKGSTYLLMQDPDEKFSFEYGFTAKDGEESISCEVYKSENCRMTLLLDEKGMPFAGWTWFEKTPEMGKMNTHLYKQGLTIMPSISTKKSDTDLSQVLDKIKQAPNGEKKDIVGVDKPVEELLHDWQKEMNLPDLTAQAVKGKGYQNSQVVQDFMDLLDQHNDFMADFWTWDDYWCEHTKVTTKEDDFVYASTAYDYDSVVRDLGNSDTVWKTTGYELGKKDSDYLGDPGKNDYFWQTVGHGPVGWPKALTPSSKSKFIAAYDATIDGEDFIVEEWEWMSIQRSQKTFGDRMQIIYFCKDGKVVGFTERKDDEISTTYLMEFKEGTDEELFKLEATVTN